MTIAIGLLAADGIVIAADTQETVGSYKSDESKLLIANQGKAGDKAGAIAVTGAGDAGYLDSCNQELCAIFLSKKNWTAAALLAKSKKQIKRFHDDHVVPYALFPEHDRPQLSLIIAAQINDNRYCLWSTEKSALFHSKKYFSVGLGRAYAQIMLRRFWAPMDTVKAASLAAYIIFHVKHSIDGCGNETQIVIIKDGYAEYIQPPSIELMENYFDERAALENQLLHFSLGMEMPEEDVNFTLARFSSMLLKNRKDVTDCQNFKMSSYRRGKRPVDQPEIVRHTKKSPD